MHRPPEEVFETSLDIGAIKQMTPWHEVHEEVEIAAWARRVTGATSQDNRTRVAPFTVAICTISARFSSTNLLMSIAWLPCDSTDIPQVKLGIPSCAELMIAQRALNATRPVYV